MLRDTDFSFEKYIFHTCVKFSKKLPKIFPDFPDMQTYRMGAYQAVSNVSFSENFVYLKMDDSLLFLNLPNSKSVSSLK